MVRGGQARLAVRARTLHDLEAGGNDSAAMGALIVERIVRAHLRTMARLNIGYDLLTYQGDILRLQFWAHAFEILKAQGAVFLQTEGKLAGCWVMRIDEGDRDASRPAANRGPSRTKPREKVIVRSNGVVTYVGKDIANQFWKFGLLGKDFHYRLFATQGNRQPLWATTSDDGDPKAPPFGTRADLQRHRLAPDVSAGAAQPGAADARPRGRSRKLDPFLGRDGGAVARDGKELGYQLERRAMPQKPFVEVSGRKGLGVKIDDLLDLLIAKATRRSARSATPSCPADERGRTASQIAVAAIRYFMLKFSRGKLIVFDIEEALSFEGETGPYLQYAVVRRTTSSTSCRNARA